MKTNNLKVKDRYNDNWFSYYKNHVYKNRITDINTAINNKVIIDNLPRSISYGVHQDETGKLIREIYS